jgi:hypothetical protein
MVTLFRVFRCPWAQAKEILIGKWLLFLTFSGVHARLKKVRVS